MANYFKDNFIKNAQPDNFTKYANLFAEQFLPLINNDKKKFEEIIQEVEPKSWRYFNREIRKACDQYCTDNKLMNHADFQKKWFYESVMLGRTTHGAKAPWINETSEIKEITKALPKGKTVEVDLADETIEEGRVTKFPYVKNGWMHLKDGAYMIQN